MPWIRSLAGTSAWTLTLLLVACSPGAPAASDEARPAAREFSVAEKQAAYALSLGSATEIAHADEGPFDRSVRCRTALAVLRTELGRGDSVGEQQLAALAQAERVFARQARAAGAQAGRTPAQIDTALQQAAKQPPSLSDAARAALGCVRQPPA